MNFLNKKILFFIFFICIGSVYNTFCMNDLFLNEPVINQNGGAGFGLPANNGQRNFVNGSQVAKVLTFFITGAAVLGLDYLLNKNQYYNKNINPKVKKVCIFVGRPGTMALALFCPFLVVSSIFLWAATTLENQN